MLPKTILTSKGYSIEKSACTADDITAIKKELCVSPAKIPSFAAITVSFKLWLDSPSRYYLPTAWATQRFGKALGETRPEGDPLPSSLIFQGTLRPHQVEALTAFRAAGRCGIICLPCGYGKTFTGIAAASADPNVVSRCFMVIVHKEFLADQWTSELKALLPGVRIGRIQGEKCEIGPDIDVAIAMIQTICSRPYPVGTFARFGFAIFDEVHHLGAEHFSQALQRINCRRMLGLTATPTRTDGLSKVFEWYLGPIVYQIKNRPLDDTVVVEVMRYVCDDAAYADVPTDWRGNVISAIMINQIADYKPRTTAILEWVRPMLEESGRKLLILSDRREHLVEFEEGFKSRDVDSIGYYVGGMKQKDLDISATKRVILGTYAMASEGMNIPSLNMVLLATPKSNVEQSVGRILRLKKEERTVQPMICDVLDSAFVQCFGQWTKRKRFYKSCGYKVRFMGEGDVDEEKEEKDATPKGICLIQDND